MSHETLASAWSALTDLQDLTAGLRDIVGNFTLRSIRSNYHPEDSPKRFVEYAHELSLTFDAIRFLCRIDSKNTALLQEDLVSAVVHFLHLLANDCGNDQSAVRQNSHRLILGHAFCAAVATLRTCAWDCRPELRTLLCKHAGKLLNNAPVKDESLWLVQTLANLLVSHYASATPLGQGIDQSNTRWKMLWEAKSSRTVIIQDMVKRATDTNVASAERIVPVLDLCQLYWDTDALLVQASAGLTKPQVLERVFYVPTDTDAIALAMEVRFAVQEQFAVRNMRAVSASDKLQAQSCVMFRPGMRLQCVSDACTCSFDATVMDMINEIRSTQNSLLRSAVAAAYNDCACMGFAGDFFDNIYQGYAQRLRRWHSPVSSREVATQTKVESDVGDDEPVPEVIPLRPRLFSSHSVDVDGFHEHIEIKSRSASQPNIHRRYSRPRQPSGRGTEWKPAPSVSLSTQVEEPFGLRHQIEDREEDDDAEDVSNAPAELEAPLSAQSRSSMASPDLERSESLTTNTNSTSTGYRSHHSQVPRIATTVAKKSHEYPLPEPVIVPERFVRSPQDFEKNYPEVAVGAVTAIHEDNESLFSEGGSMPMTTRSSNGGGRVMSQKKFSLFKGGKRNSTTFAVPTVRFFTSAKHMVAWTRYGGACFDVSNPGSTKMQPINAADIVLAAGGTRRYAVVARYQEAYTLSVYNLGDSEPGLKVKLGSCPKAMDVSKSDGYLAIKYSNGVRIFDLERGQKIDHKLPKMECTNNPPGGHLVTFSHDSQSFMASTRMGPEKVLTYWSLCMEKTRALTVYSNAPCGNIDDHGLTSLTLAGPSVRGIATGFLSTYTEKGSPVILSMSTKQPHAIAVRGSRDMIGTRIHGAAMHVDPHTKKSNLVMVNSNNDIFWVSDVFGRSQEIARLKSLKRPKSMRPEIICAMPNADECNIFWIDQKAQCGLLVIIGRSGGITRPFEIDLNCEPICGG